MSETGKPNAAVLQLAFWEAMKRCDTDARVHDMEMPCFSRGGSDSLVDGYLPDLLWEHMSAALNELAEAADV